MKTFASLLVTIFFFNFSFGQQSLNSRVDFLPNQKDSNNVFVLLGGSFIFPFNETTSFQKSNLVADYQKGNRIFHGEMEMLLFPSMKYSNRIEPHFFFRVQAFPMQYLSSSFGGGVSDRELNSSTGFFIGQYFRRVPYESNFVTRRRRTFEYYPMFGFYLQSSSDDVSFFFSFAKEKERTFHSVKISFHLGESFSLGKRGSLTRGTYAVLLSESFTGSGFGVSMSPVKGLRVELLHVWPDRSEQEEQARLRNKLSPGILLRAIYVVN